MRLNLRYWAWKEIREGNTGKCSKYIMYIYENEMMKPITVYNEYIPLRGILIYFIETELHHFLKLLFLNTFVYMYIYIHKYINKLC